MKTLQLAAPQTQFRIHADAQTILHRIYHHIQAQPNGQDFSLLGGEMGIALFERYYQNHFGLTEVNRTWERIEASLEAIADGVQTHAFAGGISGIAWGFLHLYNTGLLSNVEIDAQSIVEELDEPLFMAAMSFLQEADFDYLHGGLGVMLYFLERNPTPQINHYITALVTQLEKLAIHSTQGGITWVFQNFSRRKPGDAVSYNLSLSHGTASIVAILALLYEKGYARERCSRLIHQALQWMWSVRNQNNIAVFPNSVTDIREDQYSRLGWCYGDLGVASAFYLAGEKLGNNNWKEIALYTIIKSTSRRELLDTTVKDSGICHGSAGISYIYQKFAKASTNALIGSAAQYWLKDTLQRALPETEDKVYLQFNVMDAINPYCERLGILEGEASIGMVLLSALGVSTRWDRFLLLS